MENYSLKRCNCITPPSKCQGRNKQVQVQGLPEVSAGRLEVMCRLWSDCWGGAQALFTSLSVLYFPNPIPGWNTETMYSRNLYKMWPLARILVLEPSSKEQQLLKKPAGSYGEKFLIHWTTVLLFPEEVCFRH